MISILDLFSKEKAHDEKKKKKILLNPSRKQENENILKKKEESKKIENETILKKKENPQKFEDKRVLKKKINPLKSEKENVIEKKEEEIIKIPPPRTIFCGPSLPPKPIENKKEEVKEEEEVKISNEKIIVKPTPPPPTPPPFKPAELMMTGEILHEESPMIQPIQDIEITLKDHQRALVRRCLNIEKYFIQRQGENYGIMSDLPGAGKTYVVLSLLWFIKQYYVKFDIPPKERLCSLICVPQNILSQWVDAIKKYSPDFKYKVFTDYNDMLLLNYSTDVLFEFDCLITIPLYYHNISTTFTKMNYSFNRVFFDEIDSISNLLKTPLNAEFVWFISASFNPDFTGDYKIVKDDLPFHTAKCLPDFIHKNFSLPEPNYTELIIHNYLIDDWIPEFILKPVIHNLNGLSYENSYNVTNGSSKTIVQGYILINKRANNEKQFMRFLIEDYRIVLKQYPEIIKFLMEQIKAMEMKMPIDDITRQNIDTLKMEFNQKRGQLLQSANNTKKIYSKLNDESLCSLCYNFMYPNIYTAPCCKESICQNCFEKWNTHQNACLLCSTPYIFKSNLTLVENERNFEYKEKIESMKNERRYKVMDKIKQFERFHIQTNREKYIQKFQMENNSKIDEMERWIEKNMNQYRRVIIYSDYAHCFNQLEELFRKNRYTCLQLDGGTATDIDICLQNYKDGKGQVLFMSSDYAGYGMNLEFTTDIIFMNKIEYLREKQIIGRAQRPGRLDTLQIYYFFYMNEYESFIRDYSR